MKKREGKWVGELFVLEVLPFSLLLSLCYSNFVSTGFFVCFFLSLSKNQYNCQKVIQVRIYMFNTQLHINKVVTTVSPGGVFIATWQQL